MSYQCPPLIFSIAEKYKEATKSTLFAELHRKEPRFLRLSQ
jgi:hypothetical protein